MVRFVCLYLLSPIGAGVVSLKSSSDVKPIPFVCNLWKENEFVGELTGDISLKFQEAIDPEMSPDPNHPFTPPMSISFCATFS